MAIEIMEWEQFSSRYCETQDTTPEELADRLQGVALRFRPTGFLLLRVCMMDCRRFGERTIVPYGGNATIQTIPAKPFSPRGLASDMSEVEGVIALSAIPKHKEA